MWGGVALGLRTFSAPAPEFLACWTRLIRNGLASGDDVLEPAMRLPTVPASNLLVRRFLSSTCDSLLVMDDDMVFEPDALRRLRAGGSEYGVYGVLYASRRLPHNPIVFRSANTALNYTDDLGGNIDVEFCGMGFTLIRRAVIEKLQAGYMSGDVFSWGKLAEDGALCAAARHCGFRVGVNSDISIGHISADPVYWDAASKSYVARKFE